MIIGYRLIPKRGKVVVQIAKRQSSFDGDSYIVWNDAKPKDIQEIIERFIKESTHEWENY